MKWMEIFSLKRQKITKIFRRNEIPLVYIKLLERLVDREGISILRLIDENYLELIGIEDHLVRIEIICSILRNSKELHEIIDVNLINKFVCDWSVNEVGMWLKLLGLEEYQEKFIENNINGKELSGLGELKLKNELNVIPLGHRKKIIRYLNSFLLLNQH